MNLFHILKMFFFGKYLSFKKIRTFDSMPFEFSISSEHKYAANVYYVLCHQRDWITCRMTWIVSLFLFASNYMRNYEHGRTEKPSYSKEIIFS